MKRNHTYRNAIAREPRVGDIVARKSSVGEVTEVFTNGEVHVEWRDGNTKWSRISPKMLRFQYGRGLKSSA
jgi:hypothetical protein